MSFKDHFSALAKQYAQFRPRYPAKLFDYLAGLCAERRLAWDCACGSGQAAVSLAQHFDRVIATDASAKQVEAAEPAPGIEYRVAPAEQSGLESGSVDLIAVAQSLHWFDLDRFYVEAMRVLKPAGVLAVWTYGDLCLAGEAVERKFAVFRDAVEPYWPPERQFVTTGYRTLAFPFQELRPPRFELKEDWSLPQLLGYLRSWSALSGYVAHHNADPVAAVGRELESVWDDPNSTRRMSWPLTIRVGRKP